jgi:hypothetical protein
VNGPAVAGQRERAAAPDASGRRRHLRAVLARVALAGLGPVLESVGVRCRALRWVIRHLVSRLLCGPGDGRGEGRWEPRRPYRLGYSRPGRPLTPEGLSRTAV